jgi:hypothetical protein
MSALWITELIVSIVLYNVRGSLTSSDPPVVPFYSSEDTVRIGNSFITIPITPNYNHNYLLRCYAFTQL